ncbi:MAG: hypothetical protein AB1750_18125 [Chloroflexota bacterium]
MKLKLTLVLWAVLLLSACAPASNEPEGAASNPMPVILPNGSPAPVTEMVVVDLTTYADDEFDFAFDYPAGWMLDVITLGDRAPHAIQLTSWSHEPGLIEEVQPGGTLMNFTVQLWDPKGDLEAFAAQRMDAWASSGVTILSQETIKLADGREAREFVVQSAEEESYFLFVLLGDQYLVVSGSGDLDAARQVARSVR